jgi:geranylgeranyl diphosphate synthase, type I
MTSAPTSAPAVLAVHRKALEEALKAGVGAGDDALTAAARYVMGWQDEAGHPIDGGGKRIRPALCLFAAEALGGTADEAMPGAVAIELIHNFSLVHDEIQDRDAERHHRPTTWARMGEAQAINVGDFIYTRAFRALTSGRGDSNRRMRALDLLNDAVQRMITGQWLDIEFEKRDAVTVDEYLAMVAGKTGALLSAPLQMGAILAGVGAEQAEIVGQWGELVGAAFQAQDDYLGIWGDPNQTGKSNTNDIARRKKTLPIVHALGNPDFGAVVGRVYAQKVIGETDIAAVVKALGSAGSDAYCRERASSQAEEADALLERLAVDRVTRQQFAAIAAYVVNRED